MRGDECDLVADNMDSFARNVDWAHRNGRALGPKRIGLPVSVVYFATARYIFPPRDYRERDVAHAARQLRLPAAEQFEPHRYAADAAIG